MSITSIPSTLKLAISPEILTSFPGAKVAVLLARMIVEPKASDKDCDKFISEYKQRVAQLTKERGIDKSNYNDLRVCKAWKTVFATFEEGDKVTAISNLLGKVTTALAKIAGTTHKADLGKISNFVDVYNCVSIETLTPMGAVNLSKVIGSQIDLRYGKEGESFTPLGKDQPTYSVKSNQVVYADEKNILTWLWNYKDAAHSCIPRESEKDAGGVVQPTYILLFADQPEQDTGPEVKPIQDRPGDVELAIETAAEHLSRIGAKIFLTDYLSSSRPEVTFDLSRIESEEIVGISPEGGRAPISERTT